MEEPSWDQNNYQTLTLETIPWKKPEWDWISLWSHLCPRPELKTIEQSASNRGVYQPSVVRERKGALLEALSSQGDRACPVLPCGRRNRL